MGSLDNECARCRNRANASRQNPARPAAEGIISQNVYTRHHVIAALFAFLTGIFGLQKFYNGSWGWGIVFSSVTFLSAMVSVGAIVSGDSPHFFVILSFCVLVSSFVDGAMYLSNPERYDRVYNREPMNPWKW